MHHLPVDSALFNKRARRIDYLVRHFRRYLDGRVLDVGCDMAILRDLLPLNASYTGIDIGGDPDLRLNLEKIERLPFDDKAFDVVVCTDVLEHLDNLHVVFGELVRVSSRYVIISLPNNWASARRQIARGYGRIAHYGLPPTPQSDRHKWFFNLSEAREFLEGQAESLSLSVAEMRITQRPRGLILKAFLRLFTPSLKCYLNRYTHTLWAVLEKR